MLPFNYRDDAPYSATRKYLIHRTDAVAFILVWRGGQWTVEQTANGVLQRRFTLAEFDVSEAGQRLTRQLGEALRAVENDI